MLTSDRQLAATTTQLTVLRKTLDTPTKPGLPSGFVEAQRAKIQKDIMDLDGLIDEYVAAKEIKVESIRITSFDDLLRAPILYRLAKHLTVEEFSKEVNVSTRQIQRYEEKTYMNTSIENLRKIISQIGLNIHCNF